MKLRPWNRSVPFRGTSRDALQEHDLKWILSTGDGAGNCRSIRYCLAWGIYVRYPLSLRHVEELLAEREIDVSYENGSLLVEPLWPDIRGRNPEDAVRSVQRLYPLALVFG
jgi:hypothetical protein